MHVFTSISSNYLPKARVLCRSVKAHVPAAQFHVLLCDAVPAELDLASENFDSLITIDELPIDNRQAWIFQHEVVELCTAVKGLGFQEIFRRHDADKVVFLDPDIVVFSDLDLIESKLDEHSILVTPHQTEPESSRGAIVDHEVSSLKFGVFNLGFLAVRNSPEGHRFVGWWSDRLRDFCFDDRDKGLFTDQKWIDLAPAFFPDLGIVRDTQVNVSTWNINQREITGDLAGGIGVDGKPLCFYHFSGLDSGAMKVMADVYGAAAPVVEELRTWYVKECETMGQAQLGGRPCQYDLYSDGGRVRPAQRLIYRYREELQSLFPDPYDCSAQGGYRGWYRQHYGEADALSEEAEVVHVMRRELDDIHQSISWRVFRRIAAAYRRIGARVGLQRVLRRLSHLS
ncbi:MAG: hypothetical protein R3228_04810 [Halioglobus sp.]|nr:hypothetical protein [Halioglobus sp.]